MMHFNVFPKAKELISQENVKQTYFGQKAKIVIYPKTSNISGYVIENDLLLIVEVKQVGW